MPAPNRAKALGIRVQNPLLIGTVAIEVLTFGIGHELEQYQRRAFLRCSRAIRGNDGAAIQHRVLHWRLPFRVDNLSPPARPQIAYRLNRLGERLDPLTAPHLGQRLALHQVEVKERFSDADPNAFCTHHRSRMGGCPRIKYRSVLTKHAGQV